jgi:long-chain acyl-CoA synthetase
MTDYDLIRETISDYFEGYMTKDRGRLEKAFCLDIATMVGYWKNETATNDAIRDGWLYTGDLGRIDDDGFLYITGRKKELIVTATGKNVAPAYLEALLVEDACIAQALVIGDNRKFLTALVVPDPEAIKRALNVDALPDLNGLEIQSLVGDHIATRLAEVAKNEQIAKFTVLSRPFSSNEGELTAKLSMRRKVIEENFATEIELMYS